MEADFVIPWTFVKFKREESGSFIETDLLCIIAELLNR